MYVYKTWCKITFAENFEEIAPNERGLFFRTEVEGDLHGKCIRFYYIHVHVPEVLNGLCLSVKGGIL